MMQFFVLGVPAPKGSVRAWPIRRPGGKIKVAISSDNRQLKPWVKSVQEAAIAAGVHPILTGPVSVRVTFTLLRPKCHYQRDGSLRPAAHAALPACRPDVDKLARAVLDALTGLAWRDDGQVVELLVCKRYGDLPGALVEIGPYKMQQAVGTTDAKRREKPHGNTRKIKSD